MEVEKRYINGIRTLSTACSWIKWSGEAALEDVKSKADPEGPVPMKVAERFDSSSSRPGEILCVFEGKSQRDKFVRLNKISLGAKEVRYRPLKRKIGYNMSMPTFLEASKAKEEADKRLEEAGYQPGDILSPPEGEMVLISTPDGPELVNGQRCLRVILVDESDERRATAEQVKVFFDAERVVMAGDVYHVLFEREGQAPAYHSKRVTILGIPHLCYLHKIPKPGGIFGSLRGCIERILERDREDLLPPVMGETLEMELVLWIDAKYSGGMEKSFLKVSLVSPIFPSFISSIERWIDVQGHESRFLQEEISHRVIRELEEILLAPMEFGGISFTIVEAKNVADEKAHWLVNLISGLHRCSSCLGSSLRWTKDPFEGEPTSFQIRASLFEKVKWEFSSIVSLCKSEEGFKKGIKVAVEKKDIPAIESLISRAQEEPNEIYSQLISIQDRHQLDSYASETGLGVTWLRLLITALCQRNHNSNGVPLWARSVFALPISNTPPIMHTLLYINRRVIPLVGETLTASSAAFTSDALKALIGRDLAHFRYSPRSPFQKASQMRKIVSLQEEIFIGVSAKMRALLRCLNIVQAILYARPNAEAQENFLGRALILKTCSLIVWELVREEDGKQAGEKALKKCQTKVSELREMLKERGLDSKGNKADLVRRLMENDASSLEVQDLEGADIAQKSLALHTYVREIPRLFRESRFGTLFPYISSEEGGERSLAFDAAVEANRSNHDSMTFERTRRLEALKNLSSSSSSSSSFYFLVDSLRLKYGLDLFTPLLLLKPNYTSTICVSIRINRFVG